MILKWNKWGRSIFAKTTSSRLEMLLPVFGRIKPSLDMYNCTYSVSEYTLYGFCTSEPCSSFSSSPMDFLSRCCLFLPLYSSMRASVTNLNFNLNYTWYPITVNLLRIVTINMSETLLSILFGEDFWCWDSDNANTIAFNENGTGEVSRIWCPPSFWCN